MRNATKGMTVGDLAMQTAYLRSRLFTEAQRRQKIGTCKFLNLCEYIRDHVDPLDYWHLTPSVAVSQIMEEYMAYLECKVSAN